MIDIKVLRVGESIKEVTLIKWVKKDGEYIDRDDVIAELESEKATFEVNAEQSGEIKLIAKEGYTLNIGAVLANINEKAQPPELSSPAKQTAEQPKSKPATAQPVQEPQ